MMHAVGVVIVTYNNKDMLDSLLGQLYAQTTRVNEVIIVDNGGFDSTAELQKKYPGSIYIRMESNCGSAGGYREGIKRAVIDNDLVWMLDDDVSVNADSLSELVRWLDILEQKENVGAVRSWCLPRASFTAPRKTTSFAWRGTLIKKSVITRIGLPKEEYFIYADDTEYSLRIRRNGFDIFWIPSSSVVEKRSGGRQRLRFAGASMDVYDDPMRLYYAFRNQVHLYREYRQWWLLFKTYAYALKVSLIFLCAARTRCGEKLAAVFEGIRDGVKGKLGRNERYLPGKG